MAKSSSALTFGMALLAGMVCPIFINNISRSFGIWGTSRVYVVALIVFLLLGLLLGYFMKTATFAGVLALAGVAVGVVLDVDLDWSFRGYDRNLWPFEIVIWWIVAPVPMIIGGILGKVFAGEKRGGVDAFGHNNAK
jgi:hypothetical protein